MKHTGIPVTMLLLTLSALAPAALAADDKDDLEATMTVLDDPADLDAAMPRMDSPDDSGARDRDQGPGDKAPRADKVDDEFEHDVDDDETDLETEGRFEEGEDVDEDRFDE